MSKKSKKAPPPPPPPPPPKPTRWLTKPWTLLVAIGAVVGAFLLNINTILLNVREFPSEVQKTSDRFFSWYYGDESWSGYWTNSPEGYVDVADMNLSSEKIAIELNVKNGVIDGSIATPQICDSVPVFDFLLLRGRVNLVGNSAKVIVWDIFGGHKRDIAVLELERDGAIMSVVPKEGGVRLFPSRAKIALDPSGASPETPFCEGKQEQLIRERRQRLTPEGAGR